MANIDFGVAFWKSNGAQIRVTLSEFKDKHYIHVREYQMDGDTGNWYPTKQGYAFIADNVSDLINLLQLAENQIAQIYRPQKQLDLFETKET